MDLSIHLQMYTLWLTACSQSSLGIHISWKLGLTVFWRFKKIQHDAMSFAKGTRVPVKICRIVFRGHLENDADSRRLQANLCWSFWMLQLGTKMFMFLAGSSGFEYFAAHCFWVNEIQMKVLVLCHCIERLAEKLWLHWKKHATLCFCTQVSLTRQTKEREREQWIQESSAYSD